jgi:hypothetical protein
MTDRELMQQALDALMAADPDDMIFDAEGHMVFRKVVAIDSLRDRLAQPKTPDVTPEVTPYVIDCPRCGHCCPQRPWTGLMGGDEFVSKNSVKRMVV